MKQRVNLTIDAELVARAKLLAHRQKTSVSRLVEKGLKAITEDSHPQGRSFAERWVGKLKLAPRNPADRKREHLWRKYRLSENADTH